MSQTYGRSAGLSGFFDFRHGGRSRGFCRCAMGFSRTRVVSTSNLKICGKILPTYLNWGVMWKVSVYLPPLGCYAETFSLLIVSRATRKSFGGVGKDSKPLSLSVFRQMSASECSTSNGRAISADEVKCRSAFEAKSRVQARARLLGIMQMNP